MTNTPKKIKVLRPLPLMEWISAVTKRFSPPRHLEPITAFFDDVSNGVQSETTCSAPPRMGKTETTKHGIARAMIANPALRIGLVMYSQRAAEKRSREIRDLYMRVGGSVDRDTRSKSDWRTGVQDGGLWATSIGGAITGEGFDLIVIDDPVKDRASAESALERDRLFDWFNDTLYTRREPGCSVLVNGTRWHVDDLIGRLIKDKWDNIVLPAIDADGQSLCPDRFSVADLRKIKEQIGDYGWASLYMGTPFARGGTVFKDVYYHDGITPLMRSKMRIRIGADFAYSTKKRADFSAAVVLGELKNKYYVLEVLRMKVEAPAFLSRLAALQSSYGGARVLAYTGGQERGIIDVLQSFTPDGLKIDTRPAVGDKFTRSQPVSGAWNAGKVLLPRRLSVDADYEFEDFLEEVVGFTGQGDRHDDQVDALSCAFDAVAKIARREARRATRMGKITYGGSIHYDGGVDSAYNEHIRLFADGDGGGVHITGRSRLPGPQAQAGVPPHVLAANARMLEIAKK